ncbi:hypothetical protein [Vibrio rotiferianus]|nr:hypothetical protein [Vibrio rotiferianus]
MKPLLLTNEGTKFLDRLTGVEKITLPDITSDEVSSASLSAL